MIQFTKSYKTGDGQIFGTIEEAQHHELVLALTKIQLPNGLPSKGVVSLEDVAALVLNGKDVLIDILTTTPNSKPKARSVNGGTKKRKAVVTDATATVASTNNT
jgi:hypothetical protein